MKNYCILRIEKVHSLGSLKTREAHNFRELPLSHVDITRANKNEELFNQSGLNYEELWYQRIKEAEVESGVPISIRKNAIRAYEIVTTFSGGAELDMEEWKKANIKWMCDTFGEKNVLSMQYHDDEAVPHIHSIVVPIDGRGHLCARSFTGGKAKMKKLQSSYGKAMEPLGLSRGERYTRAKNQNLHRFYTAVENAAKAEVPPIEENEDYDSYFNRLNHFIQGVELAHLKKENQLRRRAEVAETKTVQLWSKYREAIQLQDELEEKFPENPEFVWERLRTYQKIEHSVPRKTLHTLLNNIMTKFPENENIREFFKLRKKKKKKNNSDVDINM